MIALAIEECNLHRRVALNALKVVGTSPRMLLVTISSLQYHTDNSKKLECLYKKWPFISSLAILAELVHDLYENDPRSALCCQQPFSPCGSQTQLPQPWWSQSLRQCWPKFWPIQTMLKLANQIRETQHQDLSFRPKTWEQCWPCQCVWLPISVEQQQLLVIIDSLLWAHVWQRLEIRQVYGIDLYSNMK